MCIRDRTGTALGGCESQCGSSVEWEQHAQEPLTKTANLTLDDSFFTSSGSRLDFFKNGFTRACLKHCGTTPEIKDVLMMSVITGISLSKHSRKRGEGIGSRSQDFFGILKIICLTYSELTAWKASSGIREKWQSARRCVESRLLQIVSIFLVKKTHLSFW